MKKVKVICVKTTDSVHTELMAYTQIYKMLFKRTKLVNSINSGDSVELIVLLWNAA